MGTAMPPGGFAGPVKRSVTIAGHATSISLEPAFWTALERAARERALPLSALVAAIDAARVAGREPPNLASAIRSWLLIDLSDQVHDGRSSGADVRAEFPSASQ